MEKFDLHGKNAEYVSPEAGVLHKSDISEGDKDILRDQNFSGYGADFDNENYRDNDLQQNIVREITEQKLNRANAKLEEELELFASSAREIIPVLQDQLEYQSDKLDNLNALISNYIDRKGRLESTMIGIVGNGHPFSGDKVEMHKKIEDSLDNLLIKHDELASSIEQLKGKLVYLNMMGNDAQEVDPNEN